MKAVYAQLGDITVFKPLSESQHDAANAFIAAASSKLRVIAANRGIDLDAKCDNEDYAAAVKSTVVQAVIRALNAMESNSAAASQSSQSALGYSLTMTYAAPGQQLYFLRNELKDLGIMRQTYGALEVYDAGNNGN